jgi:hypothetical protein
LRQISKKLARLLIPFITTLLLLAIPATLYGREINESFISENLAKSSYEIDPDAAAVVLYEKGAVEITRSTNKYQKKFTVYRLIKVLKSSAFNEGDINFQYYNSNAYLGKTHGTTYNLVNNLAQKTPLEKSSVYHRVIGENIYELKFAMPAVKEGSIIEYSYEINSDMTLMMPAWFFQSEYPVLRSEYELTYPFVYNFMTILQTRSTFKEYPNRKSAINENANAYKIATRLSNQSEGIILWGQKDLPAAINEPFISSLSNHIERLDIQLSEYADYTAVQGKQSVINDWNKFTTRLLEWDDFGAPYKEKKEYLEPIVSTFTKKAGSDLDKAKAIFNYCRNDFQCIDTISFTTEKKLRTVFSSKQGNSAEINLLLISMLKKAGYTAVPVVLSTLGHLKADDSYPMINRFNHIICALYLGNNRYFLDASNKYNPFGVLPTYCYNGYARIVDKELADSITISSNMLKERNIIKVNIKNITDTAIDIKITAIQGMITSRLTRRQIDGDEKKKQDYVNEQMATFPERMTLESFSFDALHDPDTNLTFNITLHKRFDKPTTTIYTPTDYIKYFEESPFKSMKRTLPIELPYQMDYIYTLDVELPQNYMIEDLPKPSIITFEGNKMSFKHLATYSKEINRLTVTSRFTTNTTYFPRVDYEPVRQFFEKMIYETNQKLTIKKS